MSPAHTALQIHAPAQLAAATPVPSDLSFEDMMKLAEVLVSTGFLPQHIKSPAQAVAIILTGRELGIPIMRSLRSFTMVKGKVTENADSQLARFKAAGGSAVFDTLTEDEAVLKLRHPNGDLHTETFGLKDAKNAQLVTADGMYKKFPKAMLRSRVITAGLKSLGWDGAVGVYDPAELAPAEEPLQRTPPTERPAHVDADGVDTTFPDAREDDGAPVAMTLREACEMVVNKRLLGDVRNSGIVIIKEWAIGKMQEGEGSGKLQRIAYACDMILAARAAGTIPEPAKAEKTAVAAVAAEPESVTDRPHVDAESLLF